jgi:hypothetical protein
VVHADARAVMLHATRIAITQAGADFQWAGAYDRHPELQTHTLLGVGEPAVVLQEAGGGLLAEAVGTAAKSLCCGPPEREVL